MSQTEVKQNTGARYIISLPVRAEWNEERTGKHVTTEGTTETIGPADALVHLQQLPAVGSRITISIQGTKGRQVKAKAQVLRLVRDLAQPLASLNIVDAEKAWRRRVWEQAGTRAAENDDSDQN